ncbi:flagellar protein FlaG [Heliorestis acidaminivorans]|uniref:flagellar protein FlaG n=1 Tax=Heliorestis acidaminivorans TaxID=553427 RepID=UPI0014784BAB|nr:flagellar protein FlaG [Heliorestis acidaminivorans]
MSINLLNQAGGSISTAKAATSIVQGKNVTEVATTANKTKAKSAEKNVNDEVQVHKFSKDTITRMMEESNTFLQSINTDIRLRWHDGTSQMMVEVFDQRDERVLRTFPTEEFLDMVSRLREFVGALVDKRV